MSMLLALQFSYLALAAYYSDYQLREYLNQSNLNITLLHTFSDPSTEIIGFVARSLTSKATYIAFTGTQMFKLPETILDDLDIFQTNYSHGYVSKGFYLSWLSVKPYILPYIKGVVYLTGHSLGASIATLASVDISLSYPNSNIYLYTYASPKVGDATFASFFDSLRINSYRFQNYWDFIPRLPLEDMGYVHVSTLILLQKVNERVLCIYGASPPTNYLKDPLDWPFQHSLSTYINLLEKCKL